MTALYGKSLAELTELATGAGLPHFAGQQIAQWLYHKHVTSIDQMTNLSKSARKTLEASYCVGLQPPVDVSQSADGTKKYLFAVDGNFVETAVIPEAERVTLCISSQAGCKMGCRFCMTGKQGFQQQLSVFQILNQLRSVQEFEQITNIVFMGMGEPMDNLDNVLKVCDLLTSNWGFAWSPKRITVSTVGLLPQLQQFIALSRCHLAISLHNPFHAERLQLMPVENVHPIARVVDLLRGADWHGQRRLSFEYIMLNGLNDTPRHLSALAQMLRGIECRVNLIRFHSIPGSPYAPSPDQVIANFRDSLTAKGVFTTIRASRGQDIQAACGLLSTLGKNGTKNVEPNNNYSR